MERLRCCELPKSVQTHSILVSKVDKGQANFDPTCDWNTRCGDHFRANSPISPFSNLSIYLWWDIGRVEMLWNSWINPHTLHLGVNCWGLISRNCHHPWLKSQGVALVVDDEYKSQHFKTIHYTYYEILERLRCCEKFKSVQSHSILEWKVEFRQDDFNPTHNSKSRCGDHFRIHIPISMFSNLSIYLWWDIGRVEMLWNSWINPHTLHLDVKRRGTGAKSLPPMTQNKLEYGGGYTW